MRTWSRGLREYAIHVLAAIGLGLALVVMAAVFMSTAAQGDRHNDDRQDDDDYSLTSASPGSSAVATKEKRADFDDTTAPSAMGVALGILVLGAGITILAWGARRPDPEQDTDAVILD
jgi:hypothetical protein